MELKIPPPILALFLGFLMWSLAKNIDLGFFTFELQGIMALILLVTGIAIDIAAIIPFRIAKTTVNPMKPSKASQLVNTGIYKFSRNPMYLGSLVLLMALMVWLGNIINVVFLFLFIWYITRFQIKPEEKVLSTLFGEQYMLYKEQVRRWV